VNPLPTAVIGSQGIGMLTNRTVRNFELFDEVEFGQRVVFVVPTNAGKTSALRRAVLSADLFSVNGEHREIENYLCAGWRLCSRSPRIAGGSSNANSAPPRREPQMNASRSSALASLDKSDPLTADLKLTVEFLNAIFKKLPKLMRKTDHHTVAPVSFEGSNRQ
jgi:hypothetical protein